MMADDDWDAIVNLEARATKFGFDEGLKAAVAAGFVEGFNTGVQYGMRVGAELGFYYGCAVTWRAREDPSRSSKTQRTLESLLELLEHFPYEDAQNAHITELLEQARAKFRLLCVHLKSPIRFTESGSATPGPSSGMSF